MANTIKRILLTPGEPAGIGPDITVQIAQSHWPSELVVIADPQLLADRAKQLHVPLDLITIHPESAPTAHLPGTLKIIPVSLPAPVLPGQLVKQNATYVISTLEKATQLCQEKTATAIVTGPVNKAILNEAGIAFSGHTEFFAHVCRVPHTVMLFVVDQLKIALVTTHLPLAEVPSAITKKRLELTLSILNESLKHTFGIAHPRILVCGLNPHAGEGGYLGREEIDIISPVVKAWREQGNAIDGPLSADTIFTPKYLENADAILAMFHDQALPLIKYLGFGHAVNVTLGLPFIRTSVDHGTALDVAGTGRADAGSMHAAIQLACALQDRHG